MRYDVDKFLFVGAEDDAATFFSEAQKLGIIMFIDPEGKKNAFDVEAAQKFVQGIKILRAMPYQEKDTKKDISDALQICQRIIDLHTQIEKSGEDEYLIEQEIERIRPLGNFSLDEVKSLEIATGLKVQFYCAKSYKNMVNEEKSLIYINSEEGLDYFMTFAKEPLKNQNLVEITLIESLESLKIRLTEILEKKHEYDRELKSMPKYMHLLHEALVDCINTSSLDLAKKYPKRHLDNHLFVVLGWVPKNKIKEAQHFAQYHNVIFEQVLHDDATSIPTYLENKGPGRVGQDLIELFDTPSIMDKDPSLWVLFAFSLFFSMIVGDGGYGLVFLGTALYFWNKKKNINYQGKRFLKLVMLLACSCIAWGFLTNSFFGIPFSDDSFVKTHSMTNWLVEKKAEYHFSKKDDVYETWLQRIPEIANDTNYKEFLMTPAPHAPDETPIYNKFLNNIMLELALFVGAIHICLGILRYVKINPAKIGWVFFIIGGYLFFPKVLNATSMLHFAFHLDKATTAHIGYQILLFGVGLATFIAILREGFVGVFEITTCVQVFGDTLSYLRIYALAFAGSIVTGIITKMAMSIPIALAIVLVVICHTFNISLAIMGGVIHGLRLNFLEWYRYSFEGGGKKFQPLQLHTLD